MYKYYIFLFLFLFILALNSCGPQPVEWVSSQTHEKVTVETNLKVIKMVGLLLDSTTVYPYTLLDTTLISGGDYGYYLYPVKDTGYIKFKYYESYGETPGPVQLADSLIINTPVDTTTIAIYGYNVQPHLFIYHKPK